jgi:hypothetical protein
MKSLVMLAITVVCATAHATPHPNPFSYPYETLAAGAAEGEQYVDMIPVRVEKEQADGTLKGVWGLRSVLTTELEYGITDRLEFGWYFQFRQGATADTPFLRFSGVKQRLRYRFAEANELPVDIGIYLEIAEFHDELEFEEKIILSKRFGAWNVVSNLWVEQEWYFQTEDTKYIYNPTLAFNYEISPRIIVGGEYWVRGRFDDPAASETTDVNNSDAPSGSNHFFGPTFLYQTSKVFLALGVYARLDGIGDSAVVNDPYGKLWVRTLVGIDL